MPAFFWFWNITFCVLCWRYIYFCLRGNTYVCASTLYFPVKHVIRLRHRDVNDVIRYLRLLVCCRHMCYRVRQLQLFIIIILVSMLLRLATSPWRPLPRSDAPYCHGNHLFGDDLLHLRFVPNELGQVTILPPAGNSLHLFGVAVFAFSETNKKRRFDTNSHWRIPAITKNDLNFDLHSYVPNCVHVGLFSSVQADTMRDISAFRLIFQSLFICRRSFFLVSNMEYENRCDCL